jgi:hypothetical protein
VLDKKGIVKQWTINKHNIKLYHGRGVVGPDYYYYKLDKNNFFARLTFRSRKTYVSFTNLNECLVSFDKKNETKYSFDICANSPKPKKTQLDSTIITSIEVIRIESASVKTVILNNQQKQIFITAWNKSKYSSSGSPRIKYLIKVQQGYVRTFNSDGFFLFEQQENAKYEFPDKTFFESLFNK